ncbi:hypothetical protein [Stakelama sediminis]|nr:hypothetical protein [Stakelama sediminis]
MMLKLIGTVSVLSLAMTVTSPVLAKDHSKEKKEHRQCRKYEVTGSNIPQLICHTDTEWKQLDKQAADVQAENRHQIERAQNQVQYTSPQ